MKSRTAVSTDVAVIARVLATALVIAALLDRNAGAGEERVGAVVSMVPSSS